MLGVERQESDDNAEEVLDEALDSSVFRGHPLGARVHGSREALASIPAEEIRAWHQQMIKSPLSITVVGSLDVKYVRQHLRRYYGRIASAGKVRSPRFHLTQHQLRTTFVPWPSGLVYIGLTTVFPFGLRDPRRLALSALNNHLGDESRWSNRLVLSLRGDNRLVYTVGSSIYSYREASILTTTTSCDPENVPRVLQAITQEYHRLKTTLLDPKEIALVTKSMLANSEDRSESSLKYANFLSRQLYTTGQVVTHRSLRERLPIATTSAAIRSVARLLLRDRTSLVLVGPMKHINRRQVVRALEF